MAEIFGLHNHGMDLDDLSAADSSEDEQRENEIKKLLEEGLCNETFDYDSDNSNDMSELNMPKLSEVDLNFPEKSSNITKHNQEKLFSEHRDVVDRSSKYLIESSHSSSNGHPNKISDVIAKLPSTSSITKNAIQTDRENEEMEARNPTISLMHGNHCPQNDNDSDLGSSMWLAADNNIDQLRTLCKFRERQMLRSEETIAALTKDKRSLNHQIGLLKSEMIQMRTQYGDLETLLRIKDEEVVYLKSKIREAVDEYERIRQRETILKDDNSSLLNEVDKQQQEIKLLSAIGTSAQQAEVDQVVRQMREKHARDTASWQKVVNELEGQIRLHKRAQQLIHEDSFAVTRNNMGVQTEEICGDLESEDKAREEAEKEFRTEFGSGDGINLIPGRLLPSQSDVNVDDQIKLQIDECKSQWEIEKKEIINFYEIEIDAYRSRLTSLPAKLYETWQKTQDELGISSPSKKKANLRSIATGSDAAIEVRSIPSPANELDKNTNGPLPAVSQTSTSESLLANDILKTIEDNVNLKSQSVGRIIECKSSTEVETSSAFIQTDQKETSSVVIQTDETLETYRILSGLMEQWAAEVSQNSERAKIAEYQVKVADEELNKLRKRFKYLQKMATSCRKEWKKQEDCLKKKNSDLKAHYVNILLKVNEKLEGIEIE